MRQEPRVLEFAADGKRRASGPTTKARKRGANTPAATRRVATRFCAKLLVTMAIYLVHAVSPSFQAVAQSPPSPSVQGKSKERAFHGALPQSVSDMREQILSAIVAGNVSELRDAIEWNEIKPDFGTEANADPIAYWKKISSDGEGHEVLAIMANLLALAPARLAIGKDPENTLVYVWPYLAELPLDQLKPAEEVDLYRLVPPATAKAMRDAKKWTWWRIAIGADGTWHTFRKYE